MNCYTKNNIRGISAVEALIGISIAALILLFITHAITRFVDIGLDIADRTQALYLAEEGIEMVGFIRNEDWNNIDGLTDGTTYYLDITGTTIDTTGTPEVIDGIFTRSFEVNPVERNGDDDIVASGTDDDDSKYVEVTVSWNAGTESLSLTSIVANISNP